ncbi:unnamed protein product [Adineta ricciae]|uniref:Uncharacterized protein n=1 Tax=Adineta ricciae TaxID=249248 RepID=A0A815T6T3_ADIRI|nr:unnamed protein product [Adineta ricciae]
MMRPIHSFFLIYFIFLNVSLSFGKTVCKPTSAGNSSIDDVPAIHQALSMCGNGGIIIIPAGQIFTIRSPLNFQDCHSCDFQIEGTLKVFDDLEYWQEKKAFFVFTNVKDGTFHSLTGQGLIDGSGQKFWDYFAKNQTYQRPLLIHITNSSNVVFNKFSLKNPAFWFIFVTDNSRNVTFANLTLSAISTSSSLPKNTDGFDTGDCSYVTISDIHVINGDDCVSFKNGSNYVTVQNLTCIGSHGLSVGSLGGDPGEYFVKNVYISNVTMINSAFATRIKFYPGGPSHGTVVIRNVTYENIFVDNCDYAFRLDNCYESDPTMCKTNPSAAKLYDINFINLRGRTSKTYDPVVANIECPPLGICNLVFKEWHVLSPSGNSTVLCSYYEHPSGIQCTNKEF